MLTGEYLKDFNCDFASFAGVEGVCSKDFDGHLRRECHKRAGRIINKLVLEVNICVWWRWNKIWHFDNERLAQSVMANLRLEVRVH